MSNIPNFTAQFTHQQLKDLRQLAQRLDLTIGRGSDPGEGSPRQLMIALADTVQRDGLEAAAKRLRFAARKE